MNAFIALVDLMTACTDGRVQSILVPGETWHTPWADEITEFTREPLSIAVASQHLFCSCR
jgi:hypothetical protein